MLQSITGAATLSVSVKSPAPNVASGWLYYVRGCMTYEIQIRKGKSTFSCIPIFDERSRVNRRQRLASRTYSSRLLLLATADWAPATLKNLELLQI